MGFYVVANKTSKAILEVGTNNLDLQDTAVKEKFLSAVSQNAGIDKSEIALYYESTLSSEAQTVMDRGSYQAVWTNDEITAIDVTEEYQKLVVNATASKASIAADGVDSTTITIEIWKADGSGIATNVNTSAVVPIITPDGPRKVNVTFTNGAASRDFTTTKGGDWMFPAPIKRYENVRIGRVATVESVLNFSSL